MEEVNFRGIAVTGEPSVDVKQVVASRKFNDRFLWMDERFHIRRILVKSMEIFGEIVDFIKVKVEVFDQHGRPINGVAVLRGGSVGMLVVLTCEGQDYAVVTVQPRLATGRFDFVEIPAGKVDDCDDVKVVAARELEEELKLKITPADLRNLSQLSGHLLGVYLSPGGCDEKITFLLYRKDVTRDELTSFEGRCTGLPEEGEQIILKVLPLDDLWYIDDAKTVLACALFERTMAKNVSGEIQPLLVEKLRFTDPTKERMITLALVGRAADGFRWSESWLDRHQGIVEVDTEWLQAAIERWMETRTAGEKVPKTRFVLLVDKQRRCRVDFVEN